MNKDRVSLIPSTVIEILSSSQEIPQGVKMVNAPHVWEQRKQRGKDIVVAVLDTGCDRNHKDLTDRVIDGKNFTDDYEGDPTNFHDEQGHGTHVAGTIGASVNQVGVAGVAPEVKLLIGKVLGNDGSGAYPWIIDAIYWAIQWRGEQGERVRVISMSLGGALNEPRLHQAIKEAVANNILVICAAGNEGDGKHHTSEYAYPGAYPEVIQVGAVDFHGKAATFTNTNDEIDLVAPGVDILSTYPNNQYARLSGTSMATPHVAGGAALLINLLEEDYERELLESEIYAQLCKRTRSLGLHKKVEGNGLLDLSLGLVPPLPTPKNNYHLTTVPMGNGYVVQLGYVPTFEEAKELVHQVKDDLLTIEGNGVDVTYLKLVEEEV